ncbi:hypothetical protein [Alcanivorax jadensis]|uniref:hypothetical protein n=1 Tax=Alcanivorax jadensis TaxID=64988 RepID=UPI002356969B|nr:hypothetical protein [Alcanivorax jadensis]
MKPRKPTRFIYLLGLVPVVFVVALLLFLTMNNFVSGTAIFGDKFGNTYEAEGLAGGMINIGILGLIAWLLFYIAYLIKRQPLLLRLHRATGSIGALCIAIGLICTLS